MYDCSIREILPAALHRGRKQRDRLALPQKFRLFSGILLLYEQQ
jgi:hypothetical protein